MIKERIALVQLARFGDLVQTSPLIQNLYREPGYQREITLFVDSRFVDIASLLEGVNKIVPVNLAEAAKFVRRFDSFTFYKFKDWVKSWRDQEVFDRVILLNQGVLTSSIAALIKGKRREGPFSNRMLPAPHRYLNAAILDRRFAPLHLCEIWAAYGPALWPLPTPRIKQVSGSEVIRERLDGDKNDRKIQKRYAINLGAGGKTRIWPVSKQVKLIRELVKSESSMVYLLGTEPDCGTAEKIINRMNPDIKHRITDLTGKTGINDLPQVLNHCDVLISSDTGTLQLAAATATVPIGLFFGGANPYETGPFKAGSIAFMDDAETYDGITHDNIDPLMVSRIASEVADKKGYWKGSLDENGITVLVAEPSYVAPQYQPTNVEASRYDALQRRRACARSFVWEDRYPFTQILQFQPIRNSVGGRNGTDGSGIIDKSIEKSFDVLNKNKSMNNNSSIINHSDNEMPFFTSDYPKLSPGEAEWYSRIFKAFIDDSFDINSTTWKEK